MIIGGRVVDLAATGVSVLVALHLGGSLWLGMYAVPCWRRRDRVRRAVRVLPVRDDFGDPVPR